MASIEEAVYLLKRSLKALCCCSCRRHEIEHSRFSSPDLGASFGGEGVSNGGLILDSDLPEDFTMAVLENPHKSHAKAVLEKSHKSHAKAVLEKSHTKLRFEDSGFEEDLDPSGPDNSTKEKKETYSSRESGYGRSIEDSVTSTEELIVRVLEVESKSKYKIEIQDLTRCWFVFRRPLEFVYLQEFLRKRIGPLGPEFRNDERIPLKDLNEFVQTIMRDNELAQMSIVQDFFHLDRSRRSSSESGDSICPPTETFKVLRPQEVVLNPSIYILQPPVATHTRRKLGQHLEVHNNEIRNSIPIANEASGCEEKKMTPSDFEFLSVIGKGSFGKVMMARKKDDHRIYAVKMLNKRMILRRNETAHVLSERSVLIRVLNHPYVAQLHFAFTTPTKIFFVLDYVNGGELFYHLQRERTFSEFRSKFYSAEICCALCYMHSQGIVYRDLKPENILLDREGHIVLTDFGLCKEGLEHESSRTGTFCGTPEYLAPEIILKKPYTRSVDWWTLGVVLHEMIYGLPPFYTKDTNAMYNAIIRKPLRLKHSASFNARDLMTQLLQKNPEKRLGSGPEDGSSVKRHSFFSEIDWHLIESRKISPPFIPKVTRDDDLRNIDPMFTKEPIGSCSSDLSRRSSSVYGGSDVFRGFSYAEEDDAEER